MDISSRLETSVCCTDYDSVWPAEKQLWQAATRQFSVPIDRYFGAESKEAADSCQVLNRFVDNSNFAGT